MKSERINGAVVSNTIAFLALAMSAFALYQSKSTDRFSRRVYESERRDVLLRQIDGMETSVALTMAILTPQREFAEKHGARALSDPVITLYNDTKELDRLVGALRKMVESMNDENPNDWRSIERSFEGLESKIEDRGKKSLRLYVIHQKFLDDYKDKYGFTHPDAE